MKPEIYTVGHSNHESDIFRELQHTFGYQKFRKHQKSIVKALLDRRDAMVLMPSGGGKSLCYQLPAKLSSGTAVIISPLISLMKDQVDGAKANGLRAEFFNSSLSQSERLAVLRQLNYGGLDMLYISPERLVMDRFRNELKRANIAFFAIDEAHCISDWGHDFRPDYLFLSKLKTEFPNTPVAAFTATATPKVREDIARRLRLQNPHNVLASFDRPNFFYQVLPKNNVKSQILDFIRTKPGESGIVYRTTRDDVDASAEFLRTEGIEALPYHAGLPPQLRQQTQDAFNNDQVDVIVATVAFGMGIDKPDVRYVIHGDLPRDLESYYQETGRAGRDGEPAHCLLLFSEGDAFKIKFFIDQKEAEEQQRRALVKLNHMIKFGSINLCRRNYLLSYLGEEYGSDSCGSCDICTEQVERVEATREAQIVMSAIARTKQRYGAGKIIDIVKGADTQAVRRNNLDEVKTYGVGADKTKKYWRHILNELIGQECVKKVGERYPTLQLTPKGIQILRGELKFQAVQRECDILEQSAERTPSTASEQDYDLILFDQLRKLRTKLAEEQNLPPYTVFQDRTLKEMAYYFPVTDDEMLSITGVGDIKLKNYGDIFSSVIKRYIDNNPGVI